MNQNERSPFNTPTFEARYVEELGRWRTELRGSIRWADVEGLRIEALGVEGEEEEPVLVVVGVVKGNPTPMVLSNTATHQYLAEEELKTLSKAWGIADMLSLVGVGYE